MIDMQQDVALETAVNISRMLMVRKRCATETSRTPKEDADGYPMTLDVIYTIEPKFSMLIYHIRLTAR